MSSSSSRYQIADPPIFLTIRMSRPEISLFKGPLFFPLPSFGLGLDSSSFCFCCWRRNSSFSSSTSPLQSSPNCFASACEGITLLEKGRVPFRAAIECRTTTKVSLLLQICSCCGRPNDLKYRPSKPVVTTARGCPQSVAKKRKEIRRRCPRASSICCPKKSILKKTTMPEVVVNLLPKIYIKKSNDDARGCRQSVADKRKDIKRRCPRVSSICCQKMN